MGYRDHAVFSVTFFTAERIIRLTQMGCFPAEMPQIRILVVAKVLVSESQFMLYLSKNDVLQLVIMPEIDKNRCHLSEMPYNLKQ